MTNYVITNDDDDDDDDVVVVVVRVNWKMVADSQTNKNVAYSEACCNEKSTELILERSHPITVNL